MLKFYILSMLAIGSLFSLAAEEYTYMAFDSKSGSQSFIGIDNLSLSFSADEIKAVNDSQNIILPLSDVKSFYFTSSPSGIDQVHTTIEGRVTVFTMSGVKIGTFDSLSEVRMSLPSDFYIVSNGAKTLKICVK